MMRAAAVTLVGIALVMTAGTGSAVAAGPHPTPPTPPISAKPHPLPPFSRHTIHCPGQHGPVGPLLACLKRV
jgi:hypothetical protein